MHPRPYEQLVAWQEAHKLCLKIYQLTKKFPPEECFRLCDQLCRAAYSAPTNVAEGNFRRTKKDKAHFLLIALSSLEELHYEIRLAFDLHYISEEHCKDIHEHIHRVTFLITRLRSSLSSLRLP